MTPSVAAPGVTHPSDATADTPYTVMLNYAGEYCDACQAAVTLTRSSDAALKSYLDRLTMTYVSSDSAYLIVSAVLQTDPTWISLHMYSLATLHGD